MSVAVYRARTATELVDGAIQLFRQNFPAFLTLGAIFYVPIAFVNAAMFRSLTSAFPAGPPPMVGGNPAFAVYRHYSIVWPIIFAWTALFYAVVMAAASDAYLEGRVDIGAAFSRGAPRFFPVLLSYFVKVLLLGIGFVLLFVPGVIIALVLFAVPSAAVLEGNGPIGVFGRSAELSRGLKGHIFKTYLLIACLLIVAYILILVVAVALGATLRIAMPTDFALRGAQFVSALLTAILAPIPPIVGVLLYYDARIRKEGFDIELMSRSVATAAPVPAV